MTNKAQQHTVIVRKIEDRDDLYIDIPNSFIDELGWDKNTKLMWFIDDGSITLRPPKDDTEDGIPAEFIIFLESDDNNDSSN